MENLMSRDTTCCFSGHRPSKLPWHDNEHDPWCIDLKARIYESLERAYNAGFRHFVCGMARGSDTYFAEAVLALKLKYSDVALEAAIPCETQSSSWPKEDIKRYLKILHKCDTVTLLQKEYTFDCMTKRNNYMVDKSAKLIAVSNEYTGGTANTIEFAKNRRLSIEILAPVE